MRFFAQFYYIIFFGNIAAVTSVTIIGNNKNTFIAVLIGKVTNTTLTNFKSQLSNLPVQEEELGEYPQEYHQHAKSNCDIALQMVTNQYSSLEGQLKRLQTSFDDQIRSTNLKMSQMVEAHSKLIQVLQDFGPQSNNFEVKRNTLSEKQPTDSLSKIIQMIDTQSKMYQMTIDTQSRTLQIFDTQSRNHQLTIDVHSKISRLSEVLDHMNNQSKTDSQAILLQRMSTQTDNQSKITAETQYSVGRILNNQSKILQKLQNVDSQLLKHRALDETYVTKSEMHQLNLETNQLFDAQTKIIQKLNTQSNTCHTTAIDTQLALLRIIDARSKKHETRLNETINQIDKQSEILQTIAHNNLNMLRNIDSNDEIVRDTQLKVIEIIDTQTEISTDIRSKLLEMTETQSANTHSLLKILEHFTTYSDMYEKVISTQSDFSRLIETLKTIFRAVDSADKKISKNKQLEMYEDISDINLKLKKISDTQIDLFKLLKDLQIDPRSQSYYPPPFGVSSQQNFGGGVSNRYSQQNHFSHIERF